MDVEKYIPWAPADSTDQEFFIVWFENRPSAGPVLDLEPASGDQVLRLYFDDAIAFRHHSQDVLMEKWWGTNSPFYQVQNSEWVAWLDQQTQGIWKHDYQHYGVRTMDGCYEVLTAVQPQAEWLPSSSCLHSDV